ncbi:MULTISPECIES: hypothetical protein [Thermoprotei]|uniref:hypothetical protein n=1 Tax=Thermoprotei TaxID=183924 RepID=UPI0031632812
MPTYQYQQLALIESLKAEGDTTDVRLSDLNTNECKAIYFTGSATAVLICNIGDGMYRISAKPVPKTYASKWMK